MLKITSAVRPTTEEEVMALEATYKARLECVTVLRNKDFNVLQI